MTLPARPVLAICALVSLAWLGWDYLFGLNRLVMPSCWDGRYRNDLVELEGPQNDWFREGIRNSNLGDRRSGWSALGNNGIRFDSEGYAYMSRWDWHAQDRDDVMLNLSQQISEGIEEEHRDVLVAREEYQRASSTKTAWFTCDWMKALTLEASAQP
jgi:hypothetical protein